MPNLKPWDRIAARVVQVGSRIQICGGVLTFEHETSEIFIEAVRKFEALSSEEKRELAEASDKISTLRRSTTSRRRRGCAR